MQVHPQSFVQGMFVWTNQDLRRVLADDGLAYFRDEDAYGVENNSEGVRMRLVTVASSQVSEGHGKLQPWWQSFSEEGVLLLNSRAHSM